jgi:hypothetical protein
MTPAQLEHILRAAADITGTRELVIIGSQAILATCADPPLECSHSVEADIFTFRSTDDANTIDGAIGEESQFHHTFGYYAHGVGEKTATLPAGWKDRLIPFKTPATGGATGLCLEPHDLAISKLVAGREKDLTYIAALLRAGLVEASLLHVRLADTLLSAEARTLCLARLQRLTTS